MNDPRSATADFGAVVSDDPSLTARLLRLVNSAFYGFPSKIESVTQALSVVGTSQLNDLVLATSVLRVFKGVPKEFVDMDSFWQHSLACGVCVRVLAAQRRESNVAGLLHDLGRLILYQRLSALRAPVERSGRSLSMRGWRLHLVRGGGRPRPRRPLRPGEQPAHVAAAAKASRRQLRQDRRAAVSGLDVVGPQPPVASGCIEAIVGPGGPMDLAGTWRGRWGKDPFGNDCKLAFTFGEGNPRLKPTRAPEVGNYMRGRGPGSSVLVLLSMKRAGPGMCLEACARARSLRLATNPARWRFGT